MTYLLALADYVDDRCIEDGKQSSSYEKMLVLGMLDDQIYSLILGFLDYFRRINLFFFVVNLTTSLDVCGIAVSSCYQNDSVE